MNGDSLGISGIGPITGHHISVADTIRARWRPRWAASLRSISSTTLGAWM